MRGWRSQGVRVQVPPSALKEIMKTNIKFFAILIFVIITPANLFASFIKDVTLQGRSDGNNVIISWQSDNEANLKNYIIERRANGNGDFISIAIINTKGNNYFYQFIDESAFKTTVTMYQYRIKIVETNGNINYSAIITVAHNVSSVKRTWGSLKAMFR